MFDEPAPAFGRFRVTAALGDGRFGLVHLGVDPETDQVVVIRTFTGRFTDEQQKKLLDALARLCARPLDHESVATPFASGVDHGVPYLVHTYLPGTSVDEFLRAHGPRPLSDVIVRVAHLAGALDFAAAAGVYHGSLSPRDIIFGSQSTGVAGFGLVQAMHEAGADVSAPLRSDDIYALAAMTFELLVGYRYTGGNIRDALAPLRGVSGVDFDALVSALEPVLAATDPGEWPETALGFAGSLHAAQLQTEGPHTTASRPSAAEIGRLSFGLDDAEALAVTPAVPEAPPAEPPVAAVGEMSFDAPLHSTPEEAPYEFGALTTAHDEPATSAPAQAIEPAPASETPAAFVPTPAFVPEPPQTPEPTYTSDASYTPEAEYVEPALHRHSPDGERQYHGADSLALDTDHARRHSEAPVFSAARPDERSGWRVFALAAIAAVVLILAVGVYLMRGTPDTPSNADDAGNDTAVTTERVDQPQPVAPSASSTPPPETAPPAAPITQEPPSQAGGVSSPPSAAPVVPAAPAGSGPATRAERVPAVPGEPVPDRAAPGSPSARDQGSTARDRTTPVRPAPRTPASPAAAEAPVATGRVLVRSTPAGARVLVDGTPRGETPAAIRDLEFGTHTIVVEAPGYPRWQQTVTLTAERPAQSFEVALDTPGAASAGSAAGAAAATAAGLQIDSRPSGAQVWIDGAPAGVTPLLLPNVAAGTHSVRIELPGFRPWTTSVSVRTGERARVAASLEER